MPDVQEVFRMATQKVKPDAGAMERQFHHQRRRTTRRKAGAYSVAAALLVGGAVLVARAGFDLGKQPSLGQPSTPTTAPDAAGPAGTVTFDGSTCSMEITADRIEPGPVVFEIVNAGDQRVMFDSWQILDGYTFQAFERTVERIGRLADAGEPITPSQGFPEEGTQVRYLQSDVIPADSSELIVTTMSSGPHAIACLRRFEGAHQSLRRFQPFGLAGPIVVR